MTQRIKSIKDLKRLPSGNFLDTQTRIVWSKAIIEKEFAEELATIKEVEKVVEKPKVEAKSKPKAKAKK
jgi:hypothetical protein